MSAHDHPLKSAVHEIINLDEDPTHTFSLAQETFVADLAFQCASLLNWSAQPALSTVLPENIWKNEMKKKASEDYPELDNDQIRRLVDRDWKVMSPGHKNNILLAYSSRQTPEALETRLHHLKSRIQSAQTKL